MHRLHDLLERNRNWSERVQAEDPGFFDRLSSVISLLGASIPDFWVAIVAIVVFSVNLAWLPTSGTGLPTMSATSPRAFMLEVLPWSVAMPVVV